MTGRRWLFGGAGRSAPIPRRPWGWVRFMAPWLLIAVAVGDAPPGAFGWSSDLGALAVFGLMAAFAVDFRAAWEQGP